MDTVFRAFGIDPKNTKSIYKYAPVFKCEIDGAFYVLKKTKAKEDRIPSYLAWLEYLKENLVQIVTPAKIDKATYRVVDDVNWILYPFIEGRVFNASLIDITEAGRLLGHIHKLGVKKKLPYGHEWKTYDEEFFTEVQNDLQTIVKDYKDKITSEQYLKLTKLVGSVDEKFILELEKAALPFVDGIWDFKANNLVYQNNGNPVLIDLDNSGNIPRILDLALSLLLFNMEMESAPDRYFAQPEWEAFKKGYFEEIELTGLEKKFWKKMLSFVFVDEVLWAITDLSEDETIRQKNFIHSLIAFDPTEFNLD